MATVLVRSAVRRITARSAEHQEVAIRCYLMHSARLPRVEDAMRTAAACGSWRRRRQRGADRGIRTMSTMPEGDAAGQRGSAQGGTHPGAPPQAGVPGQEQYGGAPYGPVPAQSHGPEPSADPGGQPGGATRVTRPQTRVTGRRVVQYLIDSFLVGIIPALASIPFAPRVISKGGGPANRAQLTIRWICLILDAIPYTWPFTGLLGFIVILCSRDRQRIGDHLARTLVVATRGTVGGPQYADAGAPDPGTRP